MANVNNKYALLNTLKSVLKARNFDEFDDAFLTFEIEQAINEINRCRKFTPTGTKSNTSLCFFNCKDRC